MIENKKMSLDDIETGEYYKNCYFNYSSDRIRFSEVIFDSCEFQQNDFRNSEWLDCKFIHLNLSNYLFANSIFYRCEFEKCQLTGADFSKNKWKANLISDSKANYLSLDSTSIDNCKFQDTKLKDSFFQAVKINNGLVFKNCELEDADFLDTNLNSVDFSTSYFDTLNISPNLIKGCIINSLQASLLISLLGMKIKDN